MRLQECAFVRRDFALNQRECQIPAENDAALARKTIRRLAATDPTPAIAMLPSAMQRINT